MKLSRIVAVIVVIALIGEGYILFVKKSVNTQLVATQASQDTQAGGAGDTVGSAGSSQETGAITTQQVGLVTVQGGATGNPGAMSTNSAITTTTVSKNSSAFLDLTGTVRAADQTKVFPVTSGQIAQVFVSEGDVVKTGDPLFKIGGINGGKTVAELQLKVAQANANAASKNLETTKSANATSEKIAQLQLQSAQNLADGNYLDLQVFDQNINGANQSLDLLNSSYAATDSKSNYDLQKGDIGLAAIKNAVSNLESSRNNLYDSYQMQINQAADPMEKTKLQQDLSGKIADIDQKLNDLYSQQTAADLTYQSGKEGVTLGLNQVMGQIVLNQTQTDVLGTNRASMATKLGLYDGTSDSARLAEQALEATKIKDEALINQVQAQAELAQANLELAKIQSDGLTVKAPIDGIVGEVIVHQGDQISPQSALTQLTSARNFELRVAVNADDAQNIDLNTPPEIMIGGHYMKVSVKSISPVADATSKLVNVTLSLPKIFFRANQNLSARLPVKFSNDAEIGAGVDSENGAGAVGMGTNGNGGQSFFVPLDAVIIGTEEQYVYTVQDGKAKKVNVKLGVINGDFAQILDGLKESDVIVVNGAKDLVDGQLI